MATFQWYQVNWMGGQLAENNKVIKIILHKCSLCKDTQIHNK